MDKEFTILYVDDERGNLNAFRNSFRRDYNVLLADNAHEGLNLFEKREIDLVISDQRMPGMTGVEFLTKALEKHPDPCRILVTAYSDIDAAQDAVNQASVFRYIRKPWDTENLRKTIEQALSLYKLKRQNQKLSDELLQKNKALEKANQELRESDQLKYDFLKIISHEMRTPLNGLKGATQLLKMSTQHNEGSSETEFISILESSSERLEQFMLIAERISSLRAKLYSPQLQETELASLLSCIAEELEPELKSMSQGITYQLEAENQTFADLELINICLREILLNASQHSPQGTRILVATHSDPNYLHLEISDQGEGFSEEVLKNVFKIFVKGRDDVNSYRDHTLGLNLALTKLVMDLHKGVAEAFNNADGGATVRLSFRHDLESLVEGHDLDNDRLSDVSL
ncbi:hybrid sensor histidine kinase/response regulator [Pelagicoccus albus]|uniref:histidine kinase n=1 Tax=Pelagicoccus albus TaxID=415222 RepID=A0A7X1B7D9_9BACT|nr:hybrid sensor histidine kinase/response regulator [Pelagicoccus albus]MBC2607049.1 hybrid sensor histidine kinase/response regulator [Pelagicoccus albus]